jgi:hypothetical protein
LNGEKGDEPKVNGSSKSNSSINGHSNDGIGFQKIIICPKNKVHLEWKQVSVQN